MKRPEVIVTTSWDDGHKLDVRLAELLKKYDIPATFYVSPHDREFAADDLLADAQVKTISRDFEIGAHTMTHPRLPNVGDAVARQEIVQSKRYLEKLLHRPVISFCYPGGNYQAKHVDMVRSAGFRYARTVRRHRHDLRGSLLQGDTSVNAYNHYQDLWKIAKFAGFNPIKTWRYFHWENLAKAMFDTLLVQGGVFHLWGHSWEIDSHADWDKLEAVLKYISGRKGVTYITNGQLPDYQPKKLLLVAPYYPPHIGGVELYAYYIARCLYEDYGWQVVVVTSGEKGLRLQRTVENGLTVYRLPYWLKLSNSPLNPWWPVWLNRIMKREDIYIVNTQAPVPGLGDMGAAVARFRHIPFVATYHMVSMAKGGSRSLSDVIIATYEKFFLPAMLRPADKIICGSDTVRDTFLAAYKAKSATITPGVDTRSFYTAPKPVKNTILYVGSVLKSDTHKGIIYLLNAMPAILKAVPAAKLVLVGPGDGPTGFMARAKELGIEKNVNFVGPKFDAEKQAWYRKATLLCLPSLNDNFPLVVLEAMASGLPVVASDVGSLHKMVDDGQTGYLIKSGDSGLIAGKIIELLQNPARAQQFGKAGRRKVEQGLTWQTRAERTDQILRSAEGDIAEEAV